MGWLWRFHKVYIALALIYLHADHFWQGARSRRAISTIYMCVCVCCQRSFELRLAKISMETVSNIWLFFSSLSAVLIKRRRPRQKPFCISWKKMLLLRLWQLSSGSLMDRQRGRKRGKRFPDCVQVKPFFGFHLLSGLKAAPDEPVASQAKFHFNCHLSHFPALPLLFFY